MREFLHFLPRHGQRIKAAFNQPPTSRWTVAVPFSFSIEESVMSDTMPPPTMREQIFAKRIRDLEARPSSDGGAAFLVGKLFERVRILQKRVEVLETILRGQGVTIPEVPKPPPPGALLTAAERHPMKIQKRESVSNLRFFRKAKRKAAKAKDEKSKIHSDV